MHVRACRTIAFPNIGFLCQLKAYESTIFGECSDVPLRLEKLFGIEIPQKKTAGSGDSPIGDAATASKTEEEKSEAKAVADGLEQLNILAK